jgi:methylphosphotriester-DNA--protein-cysteine methyltransferase
MYRPNSVVAAVKRRLAGRPTMSLAALAAELKMDRHTIMRDLRKIEGVTFHQIQAQYVFDSLDRLLTGPRPMDLKEIGRELGSSSIAASKWVRRHEAWVTAGRPMPIAAPK